MDTKNSVGKSKFLSVLWSFLQSLMIFNLLPMKNPLIITQWSVSKVILVLWVLFSLVYIGNSLKVNVIERIYEAGQQQGARSAVLQAMQLATQCQPVVLTAGENKVSLLNTSCSASEKEGAAVTETKSEEKK